MWRCATDGEVAEFLLRRPMRYDFLSTCISWFDVIAFSLLLWFFSSKGVVGPEWRPRFESWCFLAWFVIWAAVTFAAIVFSVYSFREKRKNDYWYSALKNGEASLLFHHNTWSSDDWKLFDSKDAAEKFLSEHH
ncbi:MAG: hypothetical protein LBM73_01555 [Candidatus Nomurabacteria bacterium]|jgi:NADH:ubiquinone oxidoreductase subunit 5 (subunit L)/multisubunit Na+/H+ antiporter MnhA subunit|nr:hypothetical protein [Candidatus Nomurabacteria bacterium]